jgi:phasin
LCGSRIDGSTILADKSTEFSRRHAACASQHRHRTAIKKRRQVWNTSTATRVANVSIPDNKRQQGTITMSDTDQGRTFADNAARSARDTLEKGQAAAEQTTRDVQQSYSTNVANIRDLNVKLINMAQANAEAVFDLARRIANAEAPSDMANLWSEHARRQYEMLSAQGNELTALGQKIAAASAEPITRNMGRFAKGS